MELKGVDIKWLGHAGFLLSHADKHIYIDPYHIGRTRPNADIIFLTHEHYDHLSIEDIDSIVTQDTIIVAPESCRAKLQSLPAQLRIVKAGEEKEISEYAIKVVPAYNTNKKFHPKENGWVGYIIDFSGTSVYHAGDTDVIPEMDALDVDIALLPVSGTYVMTPKEAAQAAKKMNATYAIPMHYGSIVGDPSHADEFKKLCSAKVTILEKE